MLLVGAGDDIISPRFSLSVMAQWRTKYWTFVLRTQHANWWYNHNSREIGGVQCPYMACQCHQPATDRHFNILDLPRFSCFLVFWADLGRSLILCGAFASFLASTIYKNRLPSDECNEWKTQLSTVLVPSWGHELISIVLEFPTSHTKLGWRHWHCPRAQPKRTLLRFHCSSFCMKSAPGSMVTSVTNAFQKFAPMPSVVNLYRTRW